MRRLRALPLAGLFFLIATLPARAAGGPIEPWLRALKPVGPAAVETPAPVAAPAGETSASAADEPEALPGSYELVPRSLALEDEAAAVREELAQTRDRSALDREIAAAGERLATISTALGEAAATSGLEGGQLSRARGRAEREQKTVEELLSAVSRRYRRLEDLAARWQGHRRLFLAWQDELRGTLDFPSLGDTFTASLTLIAEVEQEIAQSVPAARERQQKVQELLRQSRDLVGRIEGLLTEWRAELRRRSGPLLFTQQFLVQLTEARGLALDRSFDVARRLPPTFLEEHWTTFVWQILLTLGVAFVARWVDRRAGRTDAWHRLLSHPWAIGVFASTVALRASYEPMPGLWRLFQALLLSGTLVVLASSTFLGRRERWGMNLLAGSQLAFQLAEAAALPPPIYRLAMTFLLLVPLLALVYLAVEEHKKTRQLTPTALSLRLAAALAGGVLLGELVGFHAFARWLFEAALSSVFVIFVATFSVRFCRKLVRVLLLLPPIASLPALARIRDEVAHRLARIAKAVILVVSLLYAADIWGISDSPLAAWQSVMEAHVVLAGYRITAGRILLAAAALYASFGLSWLIRALLDEKVGRGGGLDRGAADSIKTLLHYSLIVFGFFFALSLAGFQLQNLAILAGAFGVGIGFGLQNIVNNFVSGLILLFERPVRAGDSVELGDDAGVVQRIGLRSTTIKTGDQAEVIVPNSQLIAEKVTNWTLSSRVGRVAVAVGVAYGTNLEQARELLVEIAKGHPKVLAEPAPQAVVVNLAASSVDLELRVFVAEYELAGAIKSVLLEAIHERFNAAGIAIPFPQMDVHLPDGSPAPRTT